MGSGDTDPWTEFLKELVARPGWNVDRLATASRIHRGTIYRWIKGDIKTVKVDSVRMIAKGGEASLSAALQAARSHIDEPTDVSDEDDWEAKRIRESAVSDEKKRDLLAHLARRRAQLREEIDLLLGE